MWFVMLLDAMCNMFARFNDILVMLTLASWHCSHVLRPFINKILAWADHGTP